MKRIWKIVSIALICGILTTPQIDARGRNNNQRTERSSGNTSSQSNRGNSNQRPSGGTNNSRPSGNNQNQGKPNGQNQGKPNNGNQSKPTGNNQQRPGGNSHNGGAQKPNKPKPNNNRPHNSPPNAPQRGHVTRPHCPPTRTYHRPTPPPSFRPHSGCPVLRSVLGITFGTTLNLSIDYLNRNGYSVYGYGSDVVYLRNVNQYGYMWPDATLYYGSNGLAGSQFMYSTNYYDMGRYNMVYNSLVNQYGAPVSTQSISNGVVATWWGYDNQYVSLEFRPIYTNNGQLRYFTTLSFGI